MSELRFHRAARIELVEEAFYYEQQRSGDSIKAIRLKAIGPHFQFMTTKVPDVAHSALRATKSYSKTKPR